jgi:glycosyltransferase involved in cell wall biosynthesis
MIAKPKVLVIVPAYNEEEAIRSTLNNLMNERRVRTDILLDICVVNDGSADQTAGIVSTFPDVYLLDLPFNLGIGGAMQTGYKFAWERGYDVALQFDADGQHNIEDLNIIIDPIIKGELDMVVGSRFIEKTDYKGALSRRIGIYYFTMLLYTLTKQRYTDPTSGFRAIGKNALKEFANYYPKDYPEPEVLIYLQKRGYKIGEKSVNMRERQGGVSSITPFKSIYYMLKVTLSICMQKIIKE